MVDQGSQTSAWDFPVTDINGKQYSSLGELVGEKKPALTVIVNVASQCGLTHDHYTQLTDLYNRYKSEGKGFNVIGFPCN